MFYAKEHQILCNSKIWNSTSFLSFIQKRTIQISLLNELKCTNKFIDFECKSADGIVPKVMRNASVYEKSRNMNY